MKKIKFLLMLLIAMLPSLVMADAGPPFANYKVRVSNPDGAYFYEGGEKTNEKIEYDTVVLIEFEYKENDGNIYGDFCTDDCYTINLADTKPLKIDLKDYYVEKPQTYYIFRGECQLYDGPSYNVYNKIGVSKFDIGYSFTTNYVNDTWIYIPEKNAWVFWEAHDDNPDARCVSLKYLNNFLVALEDLEIYDNMNKDHLLGTIPSGATFTALSYIDDFYYAEYNDIVGFFLNGWSDSKVAHESDEEFLVENSEGISLHEKWSTSSNVIDNIPEGVLLKTILYYEYEYNYMYKVEYNGKIGWIDGNDLIISDENEKEENDITGEPEEESESDINVPESDSGKQSDTKTSKKKMVIICLIMVLVTSLTAFAFILLFNRKKTKKNVA